MRLVRGDLDTTWKASQGYKHECRNLKTWKFSWDLDHTSHGLMATPPEKKESALPVHAARYRVRSHMLLYCRSNITPNITPCSPCSLSSQLPMDFIFEPALSRVRHLGYKTWWNVFGPRTGEPFGKGAKANSPKRRDVKIQERCGKLFANKNH